MTAETKNDMRDNTPIEKHIHPWYHNKNDEGSVL